MAVNLIGKVQLRNPDNTGDIGDAANPLSVTIVGGGGGGDASEATLNDVKTAVESIDTSVDVALSTRASEATLSDVKTAVESIDASTDVAASTRASEATLATRLAEATFTSSINTLGQKTMATSTPVVLASDQSSVAVTDGAGSLTVDAVSLPLPTGASTEATLGSILTELSQKTEPTDTQPVSATALPLPTGAATEVTLAAVATEATLGSILTELSQKTEPTDTQPVSAVSLPLPTGAASEATILSIKNTDGIKKITDPLPAGTNNIGDVDVVSSALPTGAATEATLASIDAATTSIDTSFDVVLSTRATEATLAARLAEATFTASINTLGQKAMAASTPVVVASDQSSISDQHTDVTADYDTDAGTQSVTMFGMALPASGGAVAGGTATNPVRTDPTGTTAQPVTDGGGSLTVDAASLPLPTGAATEATLSATKTAIESIDTSVDVALSTRASEATVATLLTEATFTGRINTLGQKAMAASTPVVLASDQSTLTVGDGGGSLTIDAAALPLPTGAATEATLSSLETSVDVALSTRASEATVATLLTEATFTSRINTLGQKAMTASTPVVLASDQSALSVSDGGGSLTIDATSLPLPTGAATEATLVSIDGNVDVALSTRLADSTFTGRINTLGQKAMSASTPVVIASDQTAVPDQHTDITADYDTGAGSQLVTMFGLALPASGGSVAGGTATDPIRTDPTGTTSQPVTDGGGSLTIDAASLPLPTGAATEATLVTLLTEAAFTGRINTLGQKAMTASTPVVIASDQSTLAVGDGGGSLTVDATSLPLPTGAATEATLSSLDTSIDVALSTRASEATVASLLTEATFTARVNTQGQKAMAASTPVVIASDQSVIPVSDNGSSLTVDSAQLPAALSGSGNLKTVVSEALPAGTNNIGDVDLASAIPTGDNTVGRVKLTDGTNVATIDADGLVGTNTLSGLVAKGALSGHVGNARGYASVTGTSTTRIFGTAYTEPAAETQMEFVSSSASDAAAGTGTRTLRFTYYDGSLNGPFTEDITMNGVTAVPTVATDIRFVESIESLTVGSNTTNVGTITMRLISAGATVGTLAVDDGKTHWTHHYVGAGRICKITNTMAAMTLIGGNFSLRSKDPLVSDSFEGIIVGIMRLGSATAAPGPDHSSVSHYFSNLYVSGPARITAYVRADIATPSNVAYANFGFEDL